MEALVKPTIQDLQAGGQFVFRLTYQTALGGEQEVMLYRWRGNFWRLAGGFVEGATTQDLARLRKAQGKTV